MRDDRIETKRNPRQCPKRLNKREKPGLKMGLGGTLDLDGAHAGGPRKGGERRRMVQPDR